DAIVHLRKLTRAHGVTLGIYSGKSAYTAALLADGLVDYVAFGIDLVLLNRALGDNINELKTALSTRNRS
ncbi:MAG: aldolase, partial [Pandoraea sp.]|nr:aldolase [Pandoraea sp.]